MQHGAQREGQDLDGQWAALPEPLRQLPLVGDEDVFSGGGSDDLLPEEGSAAPLDGLEASVYLVGPVHRKVQLWVLVEAGHGDPRL